MTTVLFVDSRLRSTGTDDAFEVNLRETVHLSNARMRIDKINFADSFLTTDAGANLYFSDGAGGINYVSIPVGAYTGTSLASALQSATGRATVYDSLTNSITHTLAAANQQWLSDKDLEGYTTGFPGGASKDDP